MASSSSLMAVKHRYDSFVQDSSAAAIKNEPLKVCDVNQCSLCPDLTGFRALTQFQFIVTTSFDALRALICHSLS